MGASVRGAGSCRRPRLPWSSASPTRARPTGATRRRHARVADALVGEARQGRCGRLGLHAQQTHARHALTAVFRLVVGRGGWTSTSAGARAGGALARRLWSCITPPEPAQQEALTACRPGRPTLEAAVGRDAARCRHRRHGHGRLPRPPGRRRDVPLRHRRADPQPHGRRARPARRARRQAAATTPSRTVRTSTGGRPIRRSRAGSVAANSPRRMARNIPMRMSTRAAGAPRAAIAAA